jgi:hypothetical protein
MLHTLLIVGHATCGLVALLVGCVVLAPPARSMPRWFRVYLVALVGLVVQMLAVVTTDWTVMATSQQVAFSALSLLGVYTGWRGFRASAELADRTAGWQARYTNHVGFTVISLFDGFTVVAAIDVGAPLPAVIMVAVVGVGAGIITINRVQTRLQARVHEGGKQSRDGATVVLDDS